jgi:putative nucleotidyltransferase with HDIG domain
MISESPAQTKLIASKHRWQSRRWSSLLLRFVSFLIPIVAAVLTGLLIVQILPAPVNVLGIAGWWLALIGGTLVTMKVFDRLARRVLPLAWLLRMTMAFPDEAPSRMRILLKSGTAAELRARVQTAQDLGDANLAVAAGSILALATAINNHDRTTRAHSERVQAYTDLIGRELGLVDPDRDRLRWAALLHDVGKLAVPAEILNKPEKPTEAEWAVIRTHPQAGMEIASPLVPWLGPWAQTIEHHHEWYDGSGYPYGRVGDEIALGARVVAVADAYDTITSYRSYKKPLSAETARRELEKQAGAHFDPKVVRALFNVSLGKLRRVIGPASWLAQLPFVAGLERMGRDAAVLSATLLAFLALFTGGVFAAPPAIPNGSTAPVVAAGDPSAAPPAVDGVQPGSPTSPVDGPQPEDDAIPPAITEDLPTAPVVSGSSPTTIPGPPVTAPPAATPPVVTTLAPVPSNRGPVLTDRVVSVEEDTTIVWAPGGSDPDGDRISCLVLIGPDHGSAGIATDCSSVTYTPALDYAGPDTFTILASDGAVATSATVTVVVAPVEDIPVAVGDITTTLPGNGVHIDVTANDREAESGALVVVAVSAPANGSAVVNTSGTVTYTPAPGFVGVDTFSYEVCDPTGSCATGVVEVTVQ